MGVSGLVFYFKLTKHYDLYNNKRSVNYV